MAIKTIAALRAKFEGDDRPTEQDYKDLIDTIESIEQAAITSLSSAEPVEVVADEAARLALGPSLDAGRRVKQTDNGITYVKQVETGSLVGDWVAIGDAAIEIADVSGLQAALDQYLIKSASDTSTGKLGAQSFYLNEISLNNTTPAVNVFMPLYGFEYAFRSADFEIQVTEFTPPVDGASCTVAIKNTSGGPITATLDVGVIPMNGTFPAILSAGKWMVITISALRVPITGTSPGLKYFISWVQEN